MVRQTFSGQEIISVLTDFGYVPQSHRGSHVRLRYENEDTDEIRNVDVPLHQEIESGCPALK
ncbi:MAG: type II toxin-antitoxin system HicA family toxin [Halobacteriales archaeon]|nr:type II toxin-antitoxin system HicA family toxin [Halobacteriales archaeon]